MPGRNPHEAVENYLQPLRRAISCVARASLTASHGYHTNPGPHALVINGGNSIELHGKELYYLDLRQQFNVVQAEGERGPLKVSIVAYFYAINNEQGQEILAYHWHPEGLSPVKMPHLDLSAAAGPLRHELQRAHLPTGHIALEDVIELLIAEFSVRPMRNDWQDILRETRILYERWRTWSGSGPVSASR